MSKLQKNATGFTTIEALLILILVCILGFVSLYVWRHHKTSAKSSISSLSKPIITATTYVGWKTYSDTNFTFKYPSTWTVAVPGERNSLVDINGPAVASTGSYFISPYTSSNYSSGKVHLSLSLSNYVANPTDCENNNACKIETMQLLVTKGISAPLLVTFSANSKLSSDKLANFEIVSGNTQKVGDTSIKEGVVIKGQTYQFVGSPIFISDNSAAFAPIAIGISNFTAFQQSQDYRDLVNIANSLVVN